jgi:hypothetical protein
VVKIGKQDGVQRYLCRSCEKKFRNKRKLKINLTKDVFEEFVFNKQVIREIVENNDLDKKTVVKYLNNYQLKEKIPFPREIYLVVDATYFGKRKNGSSWGVILFRDYFKKENLWWKIVDQERVSHYLEGKIFLEKLGYTIKSVTADGFLGLSRVFDGILFQICQFHTKKMCIRHLTLHPQTEAGEVLLALVKTIPASNYLKFRERLREYIIKYQNILNEKTYHPLGGWSYTHDNIRGAIHTLSKYIDYLFTYEIDRKIPKTTNTCEGYFSHVKDVVRIHRGMSRPLKEKVINRIMLNSSIVLKKKEKGK